ncbi:MAG: hypothetical protein H7144_07745 [Burkholderiales bacterium]|nr:hypothetical protein [Phycisphaerae bacterium]
MKYGIVTIFARSLSAIAVAMLLIGCASETPATQPSSVRERQDAALKDPFSYGPSAADIKKDAANKKKPEATLKSDWDRFWNP